MLNEVVKDYAAYIKLDVSSGFQTVQDVIDNMLTRLEELSSVLQMIRIKNSECNSAVSEDIIKYRHEVNTLSKKIGTLHEVIMKLYKNVDLLEKQVDRAESDFGITNDNKLKSLLLPFLKRNKEPTPVSNAIMVPEKIALESVLDSFEDNDVS
ncbi:uncharacterized protein LOC114351567 [Ostrinia furnacalis]|uniref:uncharacterized protein LOC114351567 n=1 Tax=Ostrinia furnacalis TaxID=93504 RepID=UPI00103DFD87|nr:uncharacterized protein LOC114351567 [Ostrinia furnacalis]